LGYKCLLVDDEEEVINAIVRKIDWEGLGYEVPTYAHNGLEALEMAEGDTPDVVMTDIQMPYMDGLEFSRQLRKLCPGVKIIIFSGYDEFEYAKEAIKLEAEEYILKPVNSDELSSLFTRIRESLDKEAEERQSIRKLSRYYAQSLPLLQETFYSELVSGRIPQEHLAEYLLNYQIDLKGPVYEVVLIHTSSTLAPEGLNPVLLCISVRRLAQERLEEKLRGKFFSYQGDTVMIAQMDDSRQVIELTDDCDSFCRLAKIACKAVVTVGLGMVCTDAMDTVHSLEGASQAVSSRAIYGTGKAINIMEIEPEHDSETIMDESGKTLSEILRRIRVEDTIDIPLEAGRFVDSYSQDLGTMKLYEFFITDTMSRLYRFAQENHLAIEDVFADNTIGKALPDVLEFKIMLTDILSRMQQMIGDVRSKGQKSFVLKAQEYVAAHYNEEGITIEKICKNLGVSSAYFSTVFKKETGKTFVTYLTDYRMDKAKEILMTSDKKTYVIAAEVGFTYPNYFSYVFKRQYGITPSKFRTRGEIS
jgi:two-component system response regulator YesN